jgi:transposase
VGWLHIAVVKDIKMKPTHDVTNIDATEFEALVEKVRSNSLDEQDRSLLVTILVTFRFIQSMLEQKKVAVSKLKELLFGKRTEKDSGGNKNKSKGSSIQGQDGLTATATPPITPETAPTPEEQHLDELDPPKEIKNDVRPGHGRRPSDSWTNAVHIQHSHTCYQTGQLCPACQEGKLYTYKKPAVFARIIGGAPLRVEVHHCDRLRCSLCGELFTAPLPQDIQNFPVSTPEANAVAAVTKYQAATPFNRFAHVLKGYGVPIPRARLYDMVASVAEDVVPVFQALCRFAAQGELFQNDDTRVLVQSLLKENQEAEKVGVPLERPGMFTTGIIAQVGIHRVFLYFTGRNHAGENLEAILKSRSRGLAPPTQVSDRLSCNAPGEFVVDDGACLDHLRREFYTLRTIFPSSCTYVIRELKMIYRADAIAKKKKMTPDQRLELHQKVSLPVMIRLKKWGQTELAEKRVEPNGPLAKAIRYLLKHFPALTLFTRKSGVPIANSACEQALKTPIAIRKMAYFYRTTEGAHVASVLLTLIQTVQYAEKSVFDYLTAVQKYAKDVREHPELWFPWNFNERLQILISSH